MKVIELGKNYSEAHDTFVILTTCALQGKPAETLEGMRNLSKLQDALEDISDEQTVEVDGKKGTIRVLKEDVLTLVLDDGPCDLLKARFFGAEISWLPQAARSVMKAYDRVDTARTVTQAELKVVK